MKLYFYLDHLVQIPVIHRLIEEDHLNIQKRNADIGRILEVEVETEIIVKKVTETPEIVVQKVEKGIDIIPNHALLTAQIGKLDQFQEKNQAAVQVARSQM